MPKLNFYDVKTRKKFSTDKFKFVGKKVKGNVRYFAVAKSPNGNESWRIVSKDFYNKFK